MKPATKYNSLLKEIKQFVEKAKHNIIRQINSELLFTCWHVCRLIGEKEKSEKYDEQALRQMLLDISKELTHDLWKGILFRSECSILKHPHYI